MCCLLLMSSMSRLEGAGNCRHRFIGVSSKLLTSFPVRSVGSS